MSSSLYMINTFVINVTFWEDIFVCWYQAMAQVIPFCILQIHFVGRIDTHYTE